MKKTKLYGHSGRVGEAFEKIIKQTFLIFFLGGGRGGGGCRVRELKGAVKLL